MSSEKLQDLFYMVLMAGNFLNSVSVVRRRSTGGHIYGVRGCEDLELMSAVLNRIAWWRTECSARPLMCIYLGVLGSQCRNGTLRVGVGSPSHVVVV